MEPSPTGKQNGQQMTKWYYARNRFQPAQRAAVVRPPSPTIGHGSKRLVRPRTPSCSSFDGEKEDKSVATPSSSLSSPVDLQIKPGTVAETKRVYCAIARSAEATKMTRGVQEKKRYGGVAMPTADTVQPPLPPSDHNRSDNDQCDAADGDQDGAADADVPGSELSIDINELAFFNGQPAAGPQADKQPAEPEAPQECQFGDESDNGNMNEPSCAEECFYLSLSNCGCTIQ
ncbi:Hypothetical protein CINCED_3A001661 [Cinara cedri]|uniref:Uncharacterized protein n=1 Tax=Cinara cedri TaxID=506608 RepID=A0A5E4NLA8_9HEMI|nr:Hypothetical protein CINCED_3A001661 [Cinara cedri]